MALKLSDGGGMAKLDTPMRRAVADRAASLSAEEEIRILYVALTRARDKLIITAKTGKSGADAMLDDARTRACLLYTSSPYLFSARGVGGKGAYSSLRYEGNGVYIIRRRTYFRLRRKLPQLFSLRGTTFIYL